MKRIEMKKVLKFQLMIIYILLIIVDITFLFKNKIFKNCGTEIFAVKKQLRLLIFPL